MNISELKIKILQQISETENVELLKKIQSILIEYEISDNELNVVNEEIMTYKTKNKETIVGSTPNGKKISQEDLLERAKLAIKDYNEGNFKSQNDIELKYKNIT